MAPFAAGGQDGPNDPQHRNEPDEESEKQTTLPDSPQVKVLPALMHPIEGRDVGKRTMDAIEASGDPLLELRAAVYLISSRRGRAATN
jgi:hypothetical protein